MARPQILLVNPWIHDFAAYDLWARPMGLLVLGSRLRHLGWEPVLVDCLDQDHPDMPPAKVKGQAHGRFSRSEIPKPAALQGIPRVYSRYGVEPRFIENDVASLPIPKAILVTSLMTYWYPGVQETTQLLRKVFPRTPLLLGGIYASMLPRHAAKNTVVDEVLEGPGETVLQDALFRHTGLDPAPSGAGVELEFTPALDLMRRVRYLPLLTSRGCPFRCSYCASSRMLGSHVRRDPADVVGEIQDAGLRYGIRDVALYDDAFLVDPERHAIPILEAAAELAPGTRWHTPNGLHAAAIDRRVAGALKRAGFETVRLGLESSADGFHVATGGKTDKKRFLAAVRDLKETGFAREQIGAYLLVGLPGQSRAQIEDDVDFALKAGTNPRLAEYSPIPGTSMWADAVDRARYPVADEPLFQNCTLLPTAEPGVDWGFLQETRTRITECLRARDDSC